MEKEQSLTEITIDTIKNLRFRRLDVHATLMLEQYHKSLEENRKQLKSEIKREEYKINSFLKRKYLNKT